MHAGDIFSGKNLPLLDYNNGGSGADIGATLGKAHAGIKNVEQIITGHSTVMTWQDLDEHAQFNNDFLRDVKAAMTAGKSADDVAASWKPADKLQGLQHSGRAPEDERRRDLYGVEEIRLARLAARNLRRPGSV